MANLLKTYRMNQILIMELVALKKREEKYIEMWKYIGVCPLCDEVFPTHNVDCDWAILDATPKK